MTYLQRKLNEAFSEIIEIIETEYGYCVYLDDIKRIKSKLCGSKE